MHIVNNIITQHLIAYIFKNQTKQWLNKLVLISMAIFTCPLSAQTNVDIVVVMSRSGGIYQTFMNSFIENINTDKQSSIHIYTLDKKFEIDSTKNNQMLITVGVKAARWVKEKNLNSPVIYSMLPYSVYQGLKNNKNNCLVDSSVYIDQPIERQIKLSKEIFPEKNKYGVVLGRESEIRFNSEKQTLDSHSIKTIKIDKSKEISRTMRSLSKQADIFIAVNDPLIFNSNNAKWMLYMAYQQRKPVIGFSQPYVSSGAAASVYSTPAQIAKQTAEMVTKLSKQNSNCLMPPQYPKYFKVAINKAVIKSLSGRILEEKEFLQRINKNEN